MLHAILQNAWYRVVRKLTWTASPARNRSWEAVFPGHWFHSSTPASKSDPPSCPEYHSPPRCSSGGAAHHCHGTARTRRRIHSSRRGRGERVWSSSASCVGLHEKFTRFNGADYIPTRVSRPDRRRRRALINLLSGSNNRLYPMPCLCLLSWRFELIVVDNRPTTPPPRIIRGWLDGDCQPIPEPL